MQQYTISRVYDKKNNSENFNMALWGEGHEQYFASRWRGTHTRYGQEAGSGRAGRAFDIESVSIRRLPTVCCNTVTPKTNAIMHNNVPFHGASHSRTTDEGPASQSSLQTAVKRHNRCRHLCLSPKRPITYHSQHCPTTQAASSL